MAEHLHNIKIVGASQIAPTNDSLEKRRIVATMPDNRRQVRSGRFCLNIDYYTCRSTVCQAFLPELPAFFGVFTGI
jgi:hypothetical protein